MKKYAIGLLTLSLATFAFAKSGKPATEDRLQAAGTSLHEIMAAPDKGIPEEVLADAKCIAVIPDMGKGGFIVGGEHGRGVVTCRTKPWLERTSVYLDRRRQFWLPGWSFSQSTSSYSS